MANGKGLFNELWQGIADAVVDIREKVIEEGFFGRANDRESAAPEWPQAREAEPWGSRTDTRDINQSREQEHDSDRGMER